MTATSAHDTEETTVAAPAPRPYPDSVRPEAPAAPHPRGCGDVGGRAEAPLTSEPPLPDAEPLTSESPFAGDVPLTSESSPDLTAVVPEQGGPSFAVPESTRPQGAA